LRQVTGATNPMQGWISRAYGAKTPSPALEFHLRSPAARLATLIATGPEASGAQRVSQSDVPGGRRIEVCAAGGGYAVTVTQEGTPAERVSVADGCGAGVSATGVPMAPSAAPAPAATPVAPAPTACRPGIQIPARSGPRRVLTIRYRACRPMRLTIAIRRGGRVVARRSRRVAASAGAIAIRGVRPGRVRVTARLGA